MKHYDIAIIGYGPVGAITANLFAKQGFTIALIEPKLDIWDIPRAVHFDGQTQRIFQSMGIMDEVSKIIHPMTGITFLNNKGQEIVYFGTEHKAPPNGYNESVFFNQPIFEKLLRDRASEYTNIDFMLGNKLTKIVSKENKNNLEIINTDTNETDSLSCEYLLGCDGANSFVRKYLNIESHDYKCDENWIVADYLVDKKYKVNSDRYQICDYKRPTTIVPVVGQHVRWEFKINHDDDLDHLENEDNIRSMMKPHLWRINPDIPLSSGKLLRSKAYTYHGVLAKNFKYNNCFLLGDAAHQMPPFLGQGLCQGIKDAYNLCWRLTGVRNNVMNTKILEMYSLERKGVVDFTIRNAIKQGDIIGSQDRFKAYIRDIYLNISKYIPKLLDNLRIAYSWRIKKGNIDTDLFPNKANGVIIPHPSLALKKDNKLFDEYIGNNFGLLVFDNSINIVNEIKKLSSSSIFGKNIFHIDETNEFNKDKKIFKWSKVNNISAAIIRPDKHIYGCVDNTNIINDIDQLTNKLISEIQ
ncbi:MAG: bifunctional 3-(3-hydroxy-phenyl)propionate/3-hydroxycinnamic acid hydroxylase [SAR86 cluster bacterium]|nr:MAG: bifunctional 3-(3-hydroxy-phenyl)propionate/3-hydroxycinnamic acid hydroxylase [SAR86 cluster bacterium]